MLDPDGKVPFIFPIDNVMLENIQLFLWKVEGHFVFWLSICPVPSAQSQAWLSGATSTSGTVPMYTQ